MIYDHFKNPEIKPLATNTNWLHEQMLMCAAEFSMTTDQASYQQPYIEIEVQDGAI